MSDLVRYPVNQPGAEMEVEFCCRSDSLVIMGAGRARNLNAVEVMFQADRPLPCAADIELRISWPYLLQGVCPLELYITGWIRKSDEKVTVVHIEWYEFRTRGEHSFDVPIRNGATCDVVA